MITLINPPAPWLINQKAFPPLGILYLASYLEWHDFEVEVIDLANKEDSIDYNLLDIDSKDPIFISSTTVQYPYAKLINNLIKSKNPEAVTVIGGSHATSDPEQCLKDGFNHIVVGEGELSALKISQQYEKGITPPNIMNPIEIEVLDDIPFPDRSLINLEDYGYDLDTGVATTIITSRGCPFRCVFCAKGTMSKRVRFHSPKYVEKELREIIDTYGFKNFLFVDDCFTMGKSRLEQLLERIKPLEINWRCYARADQMNPDLLRLMKDAGCVEIGIGIESGSQKILDNVGKNTKVENNLQLIKAMKKVGIDSNVFIMLGLPGETPETVIETTRFMEEARPDKFGYNMLIPYGGSDIYNNKQKGLYDIEVYDIPLESAWVKGKEVNPKSYVRTKALSREDIEQIFKNNFEYYTELTGFRPGFGKK